MERPNVLDVPDEMALSREKFYAVLAARIQPTHRPRWYLSALACLAALNHQDEVASLYTLLLKSYIPKEEQLDLTRKIREALVILVGIIGAAKIGNALRALSEVTPDGLRDPTCYRKWENHEHAVARGRDFAKSIYGENNERGRSSRIASPDYDFVVLGNGNIGL
ncbi:uncharacterized protein Z518_07407 [Rhinocladiella mackenziei CBS 650.93]|uniref:Uncharacterized protein n=1 Tax=Rhinocladiella mackenziei CBS 650.93 TaxID=1442369 RepID=A0A0D2IDE7_9EURO|nr:uncharacterized protein Z518_07407 [Rhinocladiella mackenziei CBS 650.93]KIX03854.1 hypothetical protein Z518_07407 [Rhinocladiella mackenziei CBS 650.93]